MNAIVLEKPGLLRNTQVDAPADLPEGCALVRVNRVGVCGTDWHAYRGNQPFFSYPRILGHELGVVVERVNDPQSALKPGDRCAVEPYLNCGRCVACRHDKPNCCENLKVLGVHVDGGMRERIVVPTRKLHASEKLSLDELALVEPLGIGCHAVDRAKIAAGEWVLVIGARADWFVGHSIRQGGRRERHLSGYQRHAIGILPCGHGSKVHDRRGRTRSRRAS